MITTQDKFIENKKNQSREKKKKNRSEKIYNEKLPFLDDKY
jgi:hypothetical protein